MSSNKDTVTPSAASEHLIGRVKWFNNKAGYGFITVTDGARSGSDIFVHHSVINVESQQYKYLVQGEYVEFELIRVESDKHEWQASNVSGIRGGKLMCETRHELRVARTEYKTSRASEQQESAGQSEAKLPRQRQVTQGQDAPRSRPRKERSPRVRNDEQREGDKKDWTLVRRKGPSNSAPRQLSNSRVVKSNQGSTIITIQSK